MDCRQIRTIGSGRRCGKPCLRRLRITVNDALSYLASGMSENEILRDFLYLTRGDIRACLAYASEMARERTVPTA